MWHKVPAMEREEWLQWRRKGIGGSDAAAILGISPWSTPYKVWLEKTSDYREKESFCMAHGRETEEASRRELEEIMDESFFPVNVQQTATPWVRASLDGINLEGTKVVEIKKTNKLDHALALQGKIPNKYVPQCQHILMTLHLPELYYFSSPADGSKGVVVKVQRDEDYVRTLLAPKELEFWRLVSEKIPPPLTEKDKKNFFR
jgi:putative phage-type endonuclease